MAGAAFFDLDRTLIAGDCEVVFARRMARLGRCSGTNLLAISLSHLCYMLDGNLDPVAVKCRILRRVLGRQPVAATEDVARALVADSLLPRLYRAGHAALERHRVAGQPIFIVSAAVDLLVEPIAAALGADGVVCTNLDRRQGRFTGEVLGKVPIGLGKAEALTAIGARAGIDLRQSTAYGDHYSDRYMLESVGRPVAVNPDRRLGHVARAKGWAIETWRRP